MDNSRHPAAEVLDDVSQIIEDNDGSVTVSRLTEELGHKSLSAVLAVPALAVVSPLSGVPLFSSTCGILICLVSGQMLFGRSNLWLPGWLGRKRIEGARAEKAISARRRAANWLDRHASKRLQVVLSQPFISLIRLVCLLCGALMPVLEVVPFYLHPWRGGCASGLVHADTRRVDRSADPRGACLCWCRSVGGPVLTHDCAPRHASARGVFFLTTGW